MITYKAWCSAANGPDPAAAPQTFTQTDRTGVSQKIQVPQFDPSLGTLTGATLSLCADANSTGSLQNTGASTATAKSYAAQLRVRLLAPSNNASGPGITTAAATTTPYLLEALPPLISVSNQSRAPGATLPFSQTGTSAVSGTLDLLAPAQAGVLPFFEGSGVATLPVYTGTRTVANATGGNLMITQSTAARAEAVVTYTYAEAPPPTPPGPVPVPEPRTAALLGAALLGLGLGLVRRRQGAPRRRPCPRAPAAAIAARPGGGAARLATGCAGASWGCMDHWFWRRAGMRAGLAFGAAVGGSLRADGKRMDPAMSALVRFARRRALRPQPVEQTRADYAALLSLAGLRGDPGATAAPLDIPGLPPGREHKAARRAPVGTLLFFHGGGFIMGTPALRDGLCRRIAARTGLRVVSAGYRLAPEHPFPAAHDDARTALDWVRGRGWAGPLLVGGDSAGANLAASLARDAGAQDGGGVDGQVLIYPAVDMVEADAAHSEGHYPSLHLFAEGYLLTAEAMRACAAALIPPGADPGDPRLSPIRADLSRAAPALVTVAGFDPLRDQGTAYAAALRTAGVRAELIEEDALVHGYADFAGMVPAARRAVDRIAAGIGRLLAG